MSSVLVTGGAGFIGSHLVEALLKEERQKITVVDNFDPFYDRAVKEQNIAGFASDKRVQFLELDLADMKSTDDLFSHCRPDIVVHLAAKAGVRPSIEDPRGYVRANLVAWNHVLDAAVRHQVNRIVFGSSSSVYGDSSPVPFSEDQPVAQPISPYAATKRSGELLAHAFHHIHGLSVASLRFFTVYGPRQRPDLAIHKFARRILDNKIITLFGDGTTSRDYTFIDDIVQGVGAAMRWLEARNEPVWEIVNLGNSSPCTLSDLVKAIEFSLGKSAKIAWEPMQPGDVIRTFADVRKAKQLFDYEPRTDLNHGLAKFVSWLIPR